MNTHRRQALHRLGSLIGAAAAGSVATSAWSEQTFTMKLATTTTASLDVKWLHALKKSVEIDTQGKVKCEVYPASQLGNAQRSIEGVSMGTIELTLNASGMYEGLEPRFGVLALPGLFDSMQHASKVLSDSDLRKRLGSFAAPKNMDVLTALVHSPVSIISRKPIRSLNDFKGQKIRVPGSALIAEQLKQLGASPIAMSLGEVLPAFQNGTIDGVLTGTPVATEFKYYDVAKTQTILPSSFISIVALVSNRFMQSLGGIEAQVREAARKADASTAPWADTDVGKAHKVWEQNGGEMIQLSAEEGRKYLELTVPAALKLMSAQGKQDYEALRAIAAKYR